MTLCIGAHAQLDGEPRIVLCFDHQVGDDLSISAPTFKCETDFAKQLAALWSGTLDQVEDALRIYKARLTSKTPTLADFKEEMWVGFQEFRDSLKRRGQKRATDVQLIVGGYIEGEPSLLSVSSNGVSSHPCFCAIGTGEYVADAMLRWRNTSRRSELDEVLYAVYEAKKMAEISPHVGSATTIFVLKRTKVVYIVQQVTFDAMKRLESYFRKFSPKKFKTPKEPFPYKWII